MTATTSASAATGPKTPEGKAISARNATTHGLFCRQTVLPHLGEDPAAYNTLLDALHEQLRPRNLMERQYLELWADASWKMRRLSRLEAQVWDDDHLDEDARLDNTTDADTTDAAAPAPTPDAPAEPLQEPSPEPCENKNCQNEPIPALPPAPTSPVSGQIAVGAWCAKPSEAKPRFGEGGTKRGTSAVTGGASPGGVLRLDKRGRGTL